MTAVVEEPPAETTPLEPVSEPESPGEPDEGEETPETPEAPEEPAGAALSDKEIEEALGKLAKEATRHANRVSEIMGEDAQQLVACELCEATIPGFRWPALPDEERRAAVLTAIGMGESAELESLPGAERCDLCKGLGKLATGSLVEASSTNPCPKCGAKGWTDQGERAQWDGQQAARDYAATTAPPVERVVDKVVELPASDMYGRPRGHEFYGMSPVYLTPEQRSRDFPGAQ